MKNRIVFMGTPAFSVPALRAIVESKLFEICGIYTQPDKLAGRGRKTSVSPVKELAVSYGLEVIQPKTLRSEEEVARMRSLKADIAVVSAYGKIIPENILDIPTYGCINVHPSLLPKYRGATPIPSAILNGEHITGVSIMLLDAGMDTGPLFRQKEERIDDSDNTATLSERLSIISADVLMEVLPLWLQGKIRPEPQDNSKATYTQVISKEDGKIDWNLSAVEIWRRVRAFQPWPGCFTTWKGRNLKISKAIPEETSTSQPGKVVRLPEKSGTTAGIECGDGILGILRLQLEGKKDMSLDEFIRGQKDFICSTVL
jgi:methionyl-tRNA formyltransferase